MKNNKKTLNKIYSFVICLSLIFTLLLPVISSAEVGTVYIGSAEELLEFAEKCSLDSYSRGKSFALSADISLEGIEFEPIPSFSGSFDGKGHVISGLSLYGAFSPCGLFARLTEDAELTDLTVMGSVSPVGDADAVGGIVGENSGKINGCSFIGTVIAKESVGGIAGINRLSGSVTDCSSSGEIIGDLYSGGIVGTNLGTVTDCKNESKVNTVNFTPEITLDQLNLSLTVDLSRLPSLTLGNRSDMGGICGYSAGMILGCTNLSEIGYKHIGYNVGGIAGRTCGHIYSCENKAAVNGKKDVGGIAGQIEPSVTYDLSEDLLTLLETEMNSLHGLINKAADTLDGKTAVISKRLNTILRIIGGASDSIDSISSGITDWGEGAIDEINRLSEIASVTIGMLADVTDLLPTLSTHLANSLEDLEKFIDEMEDVSKIGRDAIEDLELCLEDIEATLDLLERGTKDIENGLDLLAEAIKSEDPDRIDAALDQILTGATDISSALSTIEGAISGISEVLGGISGPDDVAKSLTELGLVFGELADGIAEMAGGLSALTSGVVTVISNLNLNTESVYSGIKSISDGLSLIVDSAETLEWAISHMRDCADHIYDASIELDEAAVHLKNAVSDLADGLNLMSKILTEADEAVKYLASVDPIQLPKPGEEVKSEADKLFNSVSSLETHLKSLNSEINGAAGDLTDIVRQINDSFSAIMNGVIKEIYGISNPSSGFDNDVTAEELDEITMGKLLNCKNSGSVYGDTNVGGIGGIMGQEISIDPEDDLSEDITLTQRRYYKLKAAVQSCTSIGNVTAKKSNVGGIVGKADLGLIYGCESCGSVESQTGSYVGGIVGISAADVYSCYSRCSLSGKSYVGGIVGTGITEELSGDSSHIKDCVSLVSIDGCSQFFGAISGFYAGEYLNNIFVSDGLRGIDRLSYEGKAEPISYDELTKKRGLPDFFIGFTLTFVADSQVIKTVSFDFGESIDSSHFPAIPEKDGYYGRWDRTELDNLVFDTVVSVVYHPYTSSIKSEQIREDGKGVFIVEGSFTDEDGIKLISGISGSPELKDSLFKKVKLFEGWIIELPSGKEASQIRYHAPIKNYEIYVNQNGSWIKVDTEEFGSYKLFCADGDRIEIAVMQYSLNLVTVIVLSAFALLLIGGAVVLIVLNRKKKRRVTDYNFDWEE